MTSETLSKLSNGGYGLPCCGLASLALITQTPLPIIYLHYKAKHNKEKQWRGATNLYHVIDMLKDYQVDFDHIKRRDMDKGRTLENYVKDNPSLYALVRTRGHIQTVLGESVHDQGGVRHVSSYSMKNKYICDVVKIKKNNLDDNSLAYRALLLVNHGVVSSMNEAYQLYERYGKHD